MIALENGTYFSYDMIGEFHSSGEWIHPQRTIESYELIFVLEGTVYIAEENQTYALQKNQLLLLEPHKVHRGYQTVTEPTAFYWFHFFTDLELPVKSVSEGDLYEIKHLLKRLLHLSNTPAYSGNAADALGYLIWEELNRLSNEITLSNRALSSEIAEYIRNHSKSGITVADVARHVGYNADYLGKYFKQVQGIGLKDYLIMQRIKAAKDYLLTSNMSIKQIANELGYHDENLFIKFFTYHEKISPSAFRNKYSNTHINHR